MAYIPSYEDDLFYAVLVARPLVKSLRCPIHKRLARVSFDYDNSGVNAYITFCCCQPFADVVAKKLRDTELFYNIKIEYVKSKD